MTFDHKHAATHQTYMNTYIHIYTYIDTHMGFDHKHADRGQNKNHEHGSDSWEGDDGVEEIKLCVCVYVCMYACAYMCVR